MIGPNTLQRSLEAEQLPAIDSVKLLQEEIDREELRIEKKGQELAKLEADAKNGSQAQKNRAKAVSCKTPI